MIRYYLECAKLIKSWVNTALTEEQICALLERPKSEEHGDIAFPCFQVAKEQKGPPPKIAADLVAKSQNAALGNFLWVKNAGPYLNFKLSAAAALAIAGDVLEQGNRFGTSAGGAGKKVLLEYSSPNVAKELHIGHFRNTILGQSLNNILSATGFATTSINHLGDWGSQFGKVAYGYLHFGNEAEMQNKPIAYLMQLYIKVNQEEEKNPEIDREARLLFKKIEDKDPELTALWKKFCDLSVKDLGRIYARLGVKFDHYIGESFYVDKIPALLDELKKKNLLVLSDGAQVVSLGEDVPPCLIITSDGTSLYATRDLAAAIWRQGHFQFDECLYVVGSEQQLHMRQFFQVLKLMGHSWADRLEHVHYGLYRFKDGKFSTRKGRVVLAEEVLDEAVEKALAIIDKKNPNLKNKEAVAEMVGVGAVIFNDLSTDRVKDVEFDWERILDFEGDTGPYLQYGYARAASILRQGEAQGFKPRPPQTLALFESAEASLTLMKAFGRLSTTLEGAQRLRKPSLVANYAIDLVKAFGGFYRQVRVLDPEAPKAAVEERLGLVQAYKQVLGNTLALLCMKTPEEM